MVGNVVAGVLFTVVATAGVAMAQPLGSVFVQHGGRIIAVPLESAAPMAPPAPVAAPEVTALPGLPSEWGALRIDGLPQGAALAIDGRLVGPVPPSSATWIALPPGPHFLEVTLPGGPALRLTVVVPVESDGYQVVPKP